MTKIQTDTLFHGGNIQAASEKYGIAIEQWLDLSTGISPFAFPVPSIPETYWRDLPYLSEDVLYAAERYYLGDKKSYQQKLLITAGSQFTIQNLPPLLEDLPVLLPSVGYQEHQAAWAAAGKQQKFYNALCIEHAVSEIEHALHLNSKQHLVIINPNNPSGLSFSVEQIKRLNKLQEPSAMLIVDEAFIDLHPENSLLSDTLPANCILLRSLGKFFGLAGLRVGCVIANAKLIATLNALQGPWPVSGPSLFIASEAWRSCSSNESTQKQAWLNSQRELINEAYHSTLDLTNRLFSNEDSQLLTVTTGLFISYLCPRKYALTLYNFFASQGILLRYVPVNSEQAIIRSSVLNDKDIDVVNRLRKAIDAFLSDHTL